MITSQQREEGLSRAYVQAVVTQAGMTVTWPQSGDDYGVDGTIRQVTNRGSRLLTHGFALDFQLKATTTWEQTGDEIVYDLAAKTYNDLAVRNSVRAIPLLLIVFCLPPEESEWLEVTEAFLQLRKCCYWTWIAGSETENVATQRIRIPRQQRLTPQVLVDFFGALERGELK